MSNAFISEEEQAEAQYLAYQRERRERRERIASVVMAGMCSRDEIVSLTEIARAAAFAANALIAELDKQP